MFKWFSSALLFCDFPTVINNLLYRTRHGSLDHRRGSLSESFVLIIIRQLERRWMLESWNRYRCVWCNLIKIYRGKSAEKSWAINHLCATHQEATRKSNMMLEWWVRWRFIHACVLFLCGGAHNFPSFYIQKRDLKSLPGWEREKERKGHGRDGFRLRKLLGHPFG